VGQSSTAERPAVRTGDCWRQRMREVTLNAVPYIGPDFNVGSDRLFRHSLALQKVSVVLNNSISTT